MRLTTDTFPQKFLLSVLALIVTTGSAISFAGENAPAFVTQSQTSRTGHVKLIWEPATLPAPDDGAPVFELQAASHPDFSDPRVVYSGSDRASFVSGLANGTYYYRVRNLDNGTPGAWSDPLEITVDHHSLSLALLLFGLGFVVVAATFAVVLRGSFQQDEAEAGGGAAE